jgi:hypothetical protein
MQRRAILKSACLSAGAAMLPNIATAEPPASPAFANNRASWLSMMQRVCGPVLEALSEGHLKAKMPVECAAGMEASRRHATYLEAVARILSGIAPWLESSPPHPNEAALHSHYIDLVYKGLALGLDPAATDYLDFGLEAQSLVDAAFLAVAVLRAPTVLNQNLPAATRKLLVSALLATRPILPGQSNWLLFSAAVEAALHALGEPWDRMRVDYALRSQTGWYVGDGTYGDGPHYHWDFYNSIVIHPFLLVILEAVGNEEKAWAAMLPAVRERAQRYTAVMERTIAPDGTYFVIGRSITYRCGVFHLLADSALRHRLPDEVSPPQARCALSAVITRTLGAKSTFDPAGWLQIGLAGHQPKLGETYISTGSLYLAACVFLPLGLPSTEPFWAAPDTRWTSQKIWAGDDLKADHAIDT